MHASSSKPLRGRDILGGLAHRLSGPAPYVAERIRWHREVSHSPAKQAVERLVSKRAVVADIGAQRGLFTARLLSLVGQNGRVHAFEPFPAHERTLRTIGRGARRPLTVHPVALSDTEGTAVLKIPLVNGQQHQGLATLAPRTKEGEGRLEEIIVPTRRLDEVLSRSGGLDFVKCDVEGHEDAVFAGGRGVISEHVPSVLVELEYRHRSRDFSATIDWLLSLDLEGFAIYPDGLRPVAHFDLERDQLQWIEASRDKEVMPSGYVNDFLFARQGHNLRSLLA